MGGSRFRRWWEALTRGLGACSVTNAAALALRLEGSSLSRLCRSFSVRACSALVGVPSGQRTALVRARSCWSLKSCGGQAVRSIAIRSNG